MVQWFKCLSTNGEKNLFCKKKGFLKKLYKKVIKMFIYKANNAKFAQNESKIKFFDKIMF